MVFDTAFSRFAKPVLAFIVAACAAFLLTVLPPTAHATVMLDGSAPETLADTGSNELFNKREYRESTIPYAAENRAYYLLTQDPIYAAYGPDETTTVSYGGQDFTARIIYCEDGLFNSGGGLTGAGGLLSGRVYPAEGVTIFVEGGTFHNQHVNNYTALTGPNLAIVGLTDPSGSNPAVFTKAPRTSTPGLERYLVNDANVRYENLVFDGQNNGMSSASSRGHYVISVSAGDKPFYMKNCTIKNFGSSNNRSAINTVLANTGQVNLEDITIDNVKTSSVYAYLQLNAGTNVNVGKITFLNANSTKRLYFDHTTAATVGQLRQGDAAFKGPLVTDDANNYITVRSYSLGNLTVPAEYRYAVMNTSTSTYTTDTIKIYNSLSAISDNVAYPIYDIVDKSWIVRSGSAYKSVESQLAGINTVLTRVAQPYPADSTTMDAKSGRGWTTKAYIRIVADENGVVPSFDVPAFSATFCDTADPYVLIRAVGDASTPFAGALAEADLVPFGKDSLVEMDAVSADKVKFYGIDFHGIDPVAENNPQLTLERVHTGIAAQSIDPMIAGASDASFAACRFTGLVNDLTVTAPALESNKATVELKDGSFSAAAEPGNVFASQGTVLPATETVFADDPTLAWESSDPSVATVDPATGEVTPLAVGTTTITARATDAHNAGELEKPAASFELEVLDTPEPPDPVDPPDPPDPVDPPENPDPEDPGDTPKPIDTSPKDTPKKGIPQVGDPLGAVSAAVLAALAGLGAIAIFARKRQRG